MTEKGLQEVSAAPRKGLHLRRQGCKIKWWRFKQKEHREDLFQPRGTGHHLMTHQWSRCKSGHYQEFSLEYILGPQVFIN